MKKYMVASGEMDAQVMAEDTIDAFRKAIEQCQPKALGFLTEIAEEGKEEVYIKSEILLKQIGKWK